MMLATTETRAVPQAGTYSVFALLRSAAPAWPAIFILLATILLALHSRSVDPTVKNIGTIDTLAKWTPLLLQGFMVDVAITFMAMLCGSVSGLMLGFFSVFAKGPVRYILRGLVQFLRNTPGLVFLFFVAFALPFKFTLFGVSVAFPGWAKVVFSFSLKIMANVAEILRGAVQSVPSAQWEAGEALALSRSQIFVKIILPQTFTRMIPPWMNVCTLFFAAVPIASLVGVTDALTYATLALKAEQRVEILIPIYGYVSAWFFAAGYAMHEWSVRIERRFAVM